MLGVNSDLIGRHGLTSEPVTLAMARGVLRLAETDIAVANTGWPMKGRRMARRREPNASPGSSRQQAAGTALWNSARPRGFGAAGMRPVRPPRIGP